MPVDDDHGYMAKIEASHLVTQPLPGAVVIKLKRDVPSERALGRAPRIMFVELSLSEAVAHWHHLGEVIRAAGAMVSQPAQADSTGLF